MKTAWVEIWTGLSGDMLAGALLDAGWSEARLRQVVEALGLGDAEVRVERRKHRGLTGLGLAIVPPGPQKARHYTEIVERIEAAGLPPRAADAARATFRCLGEAEARIHGVALERVHFHEIGAVDSIIDIVATCVALCDLGISRLLAGPIPIGRGEVEMDHGRLPVPAPATALLLEGWPVRPVEEEGEFFTPTAAALLRVLASPAAAMPSMQVERVGYGAGSREHPRYPNLVRLWIGQAADQPEGRSSGGPVGLEARADGGSSGGRGRGGAGTAVPLFSRVAVLETQVDDMDPRFLALLADRLLGLGALDVTRTAVAMKKGRLGTRLEVICRPDDSVRLAREILAGSTTLGVRTREEGRWELPRREMQVQTSLGRVRVKTIRRDSGEEVRPEYDEVVRLAGETGRGVDEILAILARELGPA